MIRMAGRAVTPGQCMGLLDRRMKIELSQAGIPKKTIEAEAGQVRPGQVTDSGDTFA